jgi:hypothetical protein
LFGGIQSRAGYPHNGPAAGAGYLLSVGPKVKVRGAAGLQPADSRFSRETAKSHWLTGRYRLASNARNSAIWFLKPIGYPGASIDGQNGMTMGLCQDQERIRGETAWTVLDAANDLGDMLTVDACRRVIDADLRGDMPAMSDMELVTAFFN